MLEYIDSDKIIEFPLFFVNLINFLSLLISGPKNKGSILYRLPTIPSLAHPKFKAKLISTLNEPLKLTNNLWSFLYLKIFGSLHNLARILSAEKNA